MQDESNTKLSGVVVFLMSNEGSKSESVLPYLYQSRAVPCLPLMLKNDNPFENNGLVEYDGVRVEIEGRIAASGTFIIDEIKRCQVSQN